MFSENKEAKDFLNNFITFLKENNKSKVNYNCYEELLEKFNDKKDFLVHKKLQKELEKFLFDKQISGFGEKNIISEKSINDFLSIEDSIDNLELFWILFGNIVLRDRFSSNRLNDYKKIIFKKNRLSIGLYIRSLLANFFFVDTNKSLVFGGTKKLLEKKLSFLWHSYFDNLGEEDEITLFRGFILNKGKIIRNPKIKDKQLEGSGICYSVNREVAVSFATTLNPYLTFLSYLNKIIIDNGKNLFHSDKKIRNLNKFIIDNGKNLFHSDKKIRKKIMSNEIFKRLLKELKLRREEQISKSIPDHKPFKTEDNCRSIVGKYKIKKKDVVIISDNLVSLDGVVLKEQQVICFPEFMSLIRYDYVNHNEFLKINSQIKTEEQINAFFGSL
jgi:hypothetical protein